MTTTNQRQCSGCRIYIPENNRRRTCDSYRSRQSRPRNSTAYISELSRMKPSDLGPSKSFQNHLSWEACCKQGVVQLPLSQKPSEILKLLFNDSHPMSSHFLNYIRQYNAAFAFTSLCTTGQQRNQATTTNSFMPFQVHGELYHLHGLINSDDSLRSSYAQLDIYDPDFAF
ncbi:MAG: hypothetical protein EXX96DRAFT_649668 [Benjaminiella poitrasii]|nr:MAG: hypothetical protein EXX96DRAFT_649668 [Benjaminiella poitrasii]